MAWLSPKWPAVVGFAGLLIVTKLIWNEIPVQDYGSYTDEDASGMAFVLLILVWWVYFVVVATATWLIAIRVNSKSIWLLLLSPAVAILAAVNRLHITSSLFDFVSLAKDFLTFAGVAVLPILVGTSSHLSNRISRFRLPNSAVG